MQDIQCEIGPSRITLLVKVPDSRSKKNVFIFSPIFRRYPLLLRPIRARVQLDEGVFDLPIVSCVGEA